MTQHTNTFTQYTNKLTQTPEGKAVQHSINPEAGHQKGPKTLFVLRDIIQKPLISRKPLFFIKTTSGSGLFYKKWSFRGTMFFNRPPSMKCRTQMIEVRLFFIYILLLLKRLNVL